MTLINNNRILTFIACFIYGLLIAFSTVNKNYMLLIIIIMPVFVLGTLTLVMKDSWFTDKLLIETAISNHTRKNTLYGLSVLLCVVILGLNFMPLSAPSLTERFLASVVIALGFVPTFIYVKDNEIAIPFLPVFGAMYSIYYGLPVFLINDYVGRLSFSNSSLDKSLMLAAAGLIVLYAAYYTRPLNGIVKKTPKIRINWDVQKATFWAILFGITGIGANYLLLAYPVPTMFQQPVLFLSQLSIIGTGILFILYLRRCLNGAGTFFLFCVMLPAIFLIKLGTGLVSGIFLFFIFMLLTYWTFKRNIPWKTTLGAVMILLILISVKTEFRELTWSGQYTEKTPIEKSFIFANMTLSDRASLYTGLKLAALRFSYLLTFAHVIEQTPDAVPYWNGETYSTLLWMPIPRLLYPAKPTKELGQEFGHRYMLLNPADSSTSYNMPQLIEMYANFGVAGVLVGMFVVGIIYRLIHDIFCPDTGVSEGGLLIGLVLFTGLTNIESDFSLVFGGLFYNALLLVVSLYMIKLRRNKTGG